MRDANEKETRIAHDLEKIKQMESLRAEAAREIAAERRRLDARRSPPPTRPSRLGRVWPGSSSGRSRSTRWRRRRTSRARVALEDAQSKTESAEHSLAEAKRDRLPGVG